MRRVAALLALGLLTGACTHVSDAPIVLGALYPLRGTQGAYGTAEFRGVVTAVELFNARGGVDGRPIRLRAADTPDVDAAWEEAHRMARAGVRALIGSYGSTLSLAASEVAHDEGMLFWETGAVADLVTARAYPEVFRTGPSGATLAAQATRFTLEVLAPKFGIAAEDLRVVVVYEDDPYGASVGEGVMREARALGFDLIGVFPYDPVTEGFDGIVERIDALGPDVVVAATYLEDGARFREKLLEQGVELKALVAKCAAFYTPEMAALLGEDINGIFVADKPMAIAPGALRPEGRELERELQRRYRARYGEDPTAAAYMGFSGAWALLTGVIARAPSLDLGDLQRAARALDMLEGSLPNGSGIRFARDGGMMGQNMRALGVVWQWQDGEPVLVYPPSAARGNPTLAPV